MVVFQVFIKNYHFFNTKSSLFIMPFSFAHPAIVLPFHRLSPKFLSLEALILGSMLPDFEYFIRMQLKSNYSHTLGGIFYFDLLLGFCLILFYYTFVKYLFISNIPSFLHQRLSQPKASFRLSLRTTFIIIISLLIGILSHLFWDMFTHPTGFFVELFPILSSDLSIANHLVPVYKILQHGSTLLGLSFISYFIWSIPRRDVSKQPVVKGYWILWLITVLLIIFIRLLYQPTSKIGHLVVIVIGACLYSLAITSLLWSLKMKLLKK